MRLLTQFLALILVVVFAVGVAGCAGPNSAGSKQAEILKRMQTSHRNN